MVFVFKRFWNYENLFCFLLCYFFIFFIGMIFVLFLNSLSLILFIGVKIIKVCKFGGYLKNVNKCIFLNKW